MAESADREPWPVGIVLNGMAVEEPGLLSMRDGRLLARLADLRHLGLDSASPLSVTPIDGDDFVELETIPGLSAELDPERANLRISASPEVFPRLTLGPEAERPVLSPILPAQFLAYDLSISSWGDEVRLTGLLDGGISGQWGVLGTTLLLPGQGLSAVRLDTAYRRDFPDDRLRLVVGDSVSRAAPGSQVLRFGGIQFGTDLSLDPQSINFALPVISGSAALPSTVELLSETQRQAYQVGPGAFDVALQPRMTGAGQVTMNIRDIAGNTRQIVRDFYTSDDLLRPGLTDFVVEAGALRQDYGVVSNRYGALFAAAGVRHPLAPWLTAQARVETGTGTSVASLGGSMVTGTLGEVSIAGALSGGSGQRGHLVRVQARRLTPVYSLSASLETASAGFRSVGQIPSQLGARREMTVAGSLSLGRLGGFNAAHAMLEHGGGTPAQQRFSITSASYTTSLFSGFLSAGVQRISRRWPNDASTRSSFFGSYTLVLGPRVSVSQFAESGRMAASFDKSVPDGAGWGVRALAGKDQGAPWLEGALAVRTAAGDFGLEASQRGTLSGVQATARGALVRIDGTMLATPRLDYAFALIDVAGDDSVTVTLENRIVARRAGGGRRVIVTGLQPYAPNHIGVDAAEVGIDVDLPVAGQVATPGWRQAAAITFGDSERRAARFRLVDHAGVSLPVGAAVQWPEGSSVVGYDGEVWLDDYAAGSAIVATYQGRHCRSPLPSDGQPLQPSGQARQLICAPFLVMESVL